MGGTGDAGGDNVRLRCALRRLLEVSTCPNDYPHDAVASRAEKAAYARAYEEACDALGVCCECGGELVVGHRRGCIYVSGERVASGSG